MKKKIQGQRRILGRMLAEKLSDEEVKMINAGFDEEHIGPSTMAVTGMGYEDN